MSQKTIDISIVIVNYNVKDFLYQCLLSIKKAKKNLQIETIIVDNNSSDNSVNYLENLFEDVKFISLNENIGFSRANNIGFKHASGKYILILNPDTLLNEDTLTKMHKFMEENLYVGLSGCKVLNSDGSFQLACRRGFPTPWASFTKLFGLQSLFPKSKLFAQYNQTYKSIDATYEVDALIGAFIFARKEIIDELNGFDETFFMYGEDIDLCYRAKQIGYKIFYFHETSIIHFKGESTKRSSINEIKHFYQAMEIFAKKHYSKSKIFLFFLKIGINFRSLIAYFTKFKITLLFLFLDLLIINSSLLIATKLRFSNFLAFPDYAYPNVFIAISLILILSMIVTGEYFEDENKVKNTFFGYLITFFILSSLTYFFKDFAFSRGVLLLTIGLSIVFSCGSRFIFEIYNNIKSKNKTIRVAFLGINSNLKFLLNSFSNSRNKQFYPIGVITTNNTNIDLIKQLNIIGHIDYIHKIIQENSIDDIIILDEKIQTQELIELNQKTNHLKVNFHKTNEFDEILLADSLNELIGNNLATNRLNINRFRNIIFKRIFDLLLSLLFLTMFLPVYLIIFRRIENKLFKLINVFIGKMSFVGIYKIEDARNLWKEGIISLAEITGETRNKKLCHELNEYYIKNFNFSLDFEIFLKYLIRK